jgi:hypothetical protein
LKPVEDMLLEGEMNVPGRPERESDGEFNTLDEPVKDTLVC